MSRYIGRTYGQANCGICNKPFIKKSGSTKYCSKECAMKAHGETGIGLNPRPCKTCGTMIENPTNPSQKFCDICIKERKREQNREQQRKYRQTKGAKKIGEIIQCADCSKEITRTTGIKQVCEECSKKREIARFKDYAKRHPDKARMWQIKATDSSEFSGNRLATLQRDNFTCQICGATNVKLHVHHIDGQGSTTDKNERNNDLSNLVTLCSNCHLTVHNNARWKGLSLPDALEFAKREKKNQLTLELF